MASREDHRTALALAEALYREVNAGNITISSSTPWLNASGYNTAALLRTFINRFRDGISEEVESDHPAEMTVSDLA